MRKFLEKRKLRKNIRELLEAKDLIDRKIHINCINDERAIRDIHDIEFSIKLMNEKLQTGAVKQEKSVTKHRRDPPKLAEFLLTMLATNRSSKAMIGDLNERFTSEFEKFGSGRSVRLYWARTLQSLGPLLWRAIGKMVVGTVKRFFGL
jgi:hypothetical protein